LNRKFPFRSEQQRFGAFVFETDGGRIAAGVHDELVFQTFVGNRKAQVDLIVHITIHERIVRGNAGNSSGVCVRIEMIPFRRLVRRFESDIRVCALEPKGQAAECRRRAFGADPVRIGFIYSPFAGFGQDHFDTFARKIQTRMPRCEDVLIRWIRNLPVVADKHRR